VNLQLAGAARKVPAVEEVVVSVLGVEQQITRAHTIDQSLDFSQATASGATAGLNLGALSGTVTGQVENRRGVQLRTSQTITRGVTISGAVGGRRYKLVWYDLIRDGTVEIPGPGGNRTLPFRYKEDAVLEVAADN
jgi:ribosome-associated protein YbcJ (S4-like RNA binding protein)